MKPKLKIGIFQKNNIINNIKKDILFDNKTGCRFIVVDAYNNGRTTKFYESINFRYLYENEQEEGVQYKIPSTETILTRLMYCDLKL